MNDIKFFIVIGILGLACLVGISSYLPERFDKGTGVRMADFPQTVGNWTGKDIQLTKRDYDILEIDRTTLYKKMANHGMLKPKRTTRNKRLADPACNC